MKPELRQSATTKHGQVPFEYDQESLDAFNDLCGQGAHARTGLCLGLCMAWLNTIRTGEPNFAAYVASPVGELCVKTYVNLIQHDGSDSWKRKLKDEMSRISFEEFYYSETTPDGLSYWLTPATSYAILVFHTSAGSHAVGFRFQLNSITLFDPNEGAVRFNNKADFLAWYPDYIRLVVQPMFGLNVGLDVIGYLERR